MNKTMNLNHVTMTGTIKNLTVKGTTTKFLTGNITQRDDNNWFKASMPIVIFDDGIKGSLLELGQTDGVTERVTISGEIQTRLDKDRKRAPWTQIVVHSFSINSEVEATA
jgi:hypothetical protein